MIQLFFSSIVSYLYCSKFDFSTLPPEDDEDYVDMGSAILTFYASLVDLLGRCAPDAESIKAGRSDALRARAILRSLVSMEDLEGVLGLRFILPVATGDGDEGGKRLTQLFGLKVDTKATFPYTFLYLL